MIIIDNVELSKKTLSVSEPFILKVTLHEMIEFDMTFFLMVFHSVDGVIVNGIWDKNHETITC